MNKTKGILLVLAIINFISLFGCLFILASKGLQEAEWTKYVIFINLSVGISCLIIGSIMES